MINNLTRQLYILLQENRQLLLTPDKLSKQMAPDVITENVDDFMMFQGVIRNNPIGKILLEADQGSVDEKYSAISRSVSKLLSSGVKQSQAIAIVNMIVVALGWDIAKANQIENDGEVHFLAKKSIKEYAGVAIVGIIAIWAVTSGILAPLVSQIVFLFASDSLDFLNFTYYLNPLIGLISLFVTISWYLLARFALTKKYIFIRQKHKIWCVTGLIYVFLSATVPYIFSDISYDTLFNRVGISSVIIAYTTLILVHGVITYWISSIVFSPIPFNDAPLGAKRHYRMNFGLK